jgi:site-specific recombinase XerD
MENFKTYLQQKELSKTTIACYYEAALKFITWCDMENTCNEHSRIIEIDNITSTEITSYLKHLLKLGQQHNTRNINLNILKHFFDWQIQSEIRQDNPAKHIKIRGTKHKTLYPIFSKQELESILSQYKILDATDKNNTRNWFKTANLSRQRNKAILSLMIYQGITTDEVNRLTIHDIKLREGIIYIAGTRQSNERTLELKPHQIMELMEYTLQVRQILQSLAPIKSDLLFLPTPSVGKQTTSNHDSTNIWKRLTAEIKSNNKSFINFKQIRTSVITHWLKQYNLRQVQYMAGHRYVSSTESYQINNIEALQDDITMYHPIK